MPIFSQPLTNIDQSTPQVAKAVSASTNVSASSLPKNVIKKKISDLGTPSISQALAGNFVEEKKEEVKTPEKYAQQTKKIDKPFTINELLEIWPKFSEKYSDQVHLHNTLSIKPLLVSDNVVKFEVENSVQQDQFRSLKPEILGYFRRNLHNESIDVHIEIGKNASEVKILTEDQKMKAMMHKNPALQFFKNRFNLDFNS